MYFLRYEVIICYFNQEDHDGDCVGVEKITLFHLDFSNEMSFCGEFLQKFLSRWGILAEVPPGRGPSWAEGVVKRLACNKMIVFTL
jgi:hypothetical protein